MSYKVSIIIPNYNRATLIGETLDSILAQSYPHWECIIVDDGSTDDSLKVIEEYVKKDSRFQLLLRPNNHPKGANACRNIGLQKASGDYVIFFDSDDLMTENHVDKKLKTILTKNYDFIIAKSVYFNNPENKNPLNYRELSKIPITADNYIQKKINWITFDPIIKTKIAKSIYFTEKNQSAEEYNYFVKLVLSTENAIAIEQTLSLRRYHENSFQFGKNITNIQRQTNYYFYYWDTYEEVKNNINLSISSKKFLLNQCYIILYNNKFKFYNLSFITNYYKTFGFRSMKKIIKLLLQ